MMSTDTWYNKNNVTSISLSPDPFKIVKNEKVVLSNLKNKFENLKIKDTNTIASKQKHQFLAKLSKDNKTRSLRVPEIGSPIKRMDESKYFELKPIKIENAIEGCISIFAENEKRITNQNFDSYLESDVRSSFDASFYNEMEIYEQRTERLDSQESGILRKITETHNDVNLNSSKFVPKWSNISCQKSDINEISENMDTFSDEMNPSDDLYSLSREKSLALKMQKRETLRNLSTLRKVHSNKVKLERNKVKEMAHQMIKNKASNLKDLCFSEIKSIVNQYNRLLDTTQNLFYNEGK